LNGGVYPHWMCCQGAEARLPQAGDTPVGGRPCVTRFPCLSEWGWNGGRSVQAAK
jgi:hypothetical protein